MELERRHPTPGFLDFSQLWRSHAVTTPLADQLAAIPSNQTVGGYRRHALRARAQPSGAQMKPGAGLRCSRARGSRVAGLPATSYRNDLHLVWPPIAARLLRCAQEFDGSSSPAGVGGSSRRPVQGSRPGPKLSSLGRTLTPHPLRPRLGPAVGHASRSLAMGHLERARPAPVPSPYPVLWPATSRKQ